MNVRRSAASELEVSEVAEAAEVAEVAVIMIDAFNQSKVPNSTLKMKLTWAGCAKTTTA